MKLIQKLKNWIMPQSLPIVDRSAHNVVTRLKVAPNIDSIRRLKDERALRGQIKDIIELLGVLIPPDRVDQLIEEYRSTLVEIEERYTIHKDRVADRSFCFSSIPQEVLESASALGESFGKEEKLRSELKILSKFSDGQTRKKIAAEISAMIIDFET